MKIYLAGPWVERKIMPELALLLESNGHTITHPWWNYEGEDQNTETPEFLRQCAKQDVAGVENCDAVIVINTAKSEGKAVEQGLAIAFEKPIICVTPGEKPSSNIFHYLSSYQHVKTFSEAIEGLKQYQ